MRRVHTERLLGWGLNVLRGSRRPVVVDLRAGSGAIALAAVHDRREDIVHAVDTDPAYLVDVERKAVECAAVGDTPISLHADDVNVTEPYECRVGDCA